MTYAPRHKGRIVGSFWYNAVGKPFGTALSYPGVNFRTDFMTPEQIANESGPCEPVELSEEEWKRYGQIPTKNGMGKTGKD